MPPAEFIGKLVTDVDIFDAREADRFGRAL